MKTYYYVVKLFGDNLEVSLDRKFKDKQEAISLATAELSRVSTIFKRYEIIEMKG